MDADEIAPPLSPDEFGRLMKKLDRSVTKGDFHFLESHIIALNKRLDELAASQAEERARIEQLTVDIKWAQQDQLAYQELAKRLDAITDQLNNFNRETASFVRTSHLLPIHDKLGKLDENEFYVMRNNIKSIVKALEDVKLALQKFTIDEAKALRTELEFIKAEQHQMKQTRVDPYMTRTLYDVNQLKKTTTALSTELTSLHKELKKRVMVVE